MTRRAFAQARRLPLSFGGGVAIFLLFIVGYYLLGIAGLQLQSAQTGVTPLWPASGFALAMAYWYGMRFLLAILPAMLALAWQVDLPWTVATIAALGSMLEAGVPLWLMRRLGIDPGLKHLRDALLFVLVGPLIGPVFSATLGSIVVQQVEVNSFDFVKLWLLWWMGNSLGILLVGGFGLVAVARRTLRMEARALAELLVASAAALVIAGVGLMQVVNISSPLVLYLLIPVFVLIAQRGDQLAVMSLGLVVLVLMLLSSAWLPPQSLEQHNLGVFYLDVSLLWVVTFTGMMISSARHEMQAREQVTWLANHDPLTHLYNRHAFMQRLEDLLSGNAAESDRKVLLYIDLDHFKELNDAEGHLAGDHVLRDVSRLLLQEVRGIDTVARLGGDEFALILEDCNLRDARSIAEAIRHAIEEYLYIGNHGEHRIQASIGLLELNAAHASPEDALYLVDSACYEAKRAGRNRVWVSP
ncbi:MAG: diguanylate cyclase [Gammaproteobacteria bacterium]|nr:diguanylate cyclase [Gammaproteobacteria bacterium]